MKLVYGSNLNIAKLFPKIFVAPKQGSNQQATNNDLETSQVQVFYPVFTTEIKIGKFSGPMDDARI